MGQQFTTQPKARFLQMICSSQSKIKRKNSELWDLHPPRGGFLWNPICSGRWAVEVKFQIQKYSNRNPICSGRWTISRNISNKRGELSKKITPPAINMKVYIWPSWENTFPFRKLKVKWIFSTKITAVFIQFHMGLPRLRRRGQGRSVWTNQCQPNLHLREELSRVEFILMLVFLQVATTTMLPFLEQVPQVGCLRNLFPRQLKHKFSGNGGDSVDRYV